MIAEYAPGADVLNCFSYTGGFGISALLSGAARVTNVDASAGALELASRNAELNGIDGSIVENVEGDAFAVLRRWRDARREFDLIVLDPPKFVESQGQLARASRGYKDINLLAMKLLRPGGVLFTFSCSALMSPELFQKIVADAGLDAGREAQIVRRLAQAADHPTLLSFPEGSYLKGFIIRTVVDR
jgi:23S rRNA (cytosine1962-C5)-methyltransferase